MKTVDPRHVKGNNPTTTHIDPVPEASPSSPGSSSSSFGSGMGYHFLTGIVQEVYSNPEELFNRIAQTTSGDNIQNAASQDLKNIAGLKKSNLFENAKIWADYLPMNSISCSITDQKGSVSTSKQLVCFPFFPPHLSLPVKPGEYVWIVKEDKGGEPIYYWMCRKVGIRQVDDLNITHMERQDVIIDMMRNHVRAQQDYSGETALKDIANFDPSPQGTGLPGEQDFDGIHTDSIAYKEEFTAEPVPRLSKKSPDLLLQGSNNAHIMLGTERFVLPQEDPEDSARVFSSYFPETFSGAATVSEALDLTKPMSPAIDLCIGRKIREISKIVESPPVKDDVYSSGLASDSFDLLMGRRGPGDEDIEMLEIDKSRLMQGKEPNQDEFVDLDPTNCLARIYLTNSPKIDEIFGFPSIVEIVGDPDNEADLESENYPEDLQKVRNYGTATVYGQNIRMRSDATMKLYNSLGQSMISMTPEGDIVIQANTETGGKIVLEAEGDIRIVPGESGIVKIGDDLKNGTINTAGQVPVTAQAIPGLPVDVPGSPKVNTTPVVTSGGGVVTGAGSGLLSTKVIIT